MRNIKILGIISVALLNIIHVSNAQAPTSGLVAYYPFSGNTNDASGNNRNGAITGSITPTTDRFGVANQAYAFNGSVSSKITVSNWNILTGNAPRTMMVWFKTKVVNPTRYNVFLTWGTSQTSATSALGTLANNTINGEKYLGFWGYDNNLFVTEQLQYYDDQWHLIAVTFDGSNLSLYLDGAFITTKTTTLSTASSALIIGNSRFNNEGFDVSMTGSLDDIRIYNRALTANEVQQTYISEAPTTSTAEVVRLGADKFISTAGIANTTVGIRAGAFSSGQNNSLFGHSTALFNTGNNNLMVGTEAGNKNSAGSDNVFAGYRAGYNNTPNTSGSQNSYFGSLAGGFGANGGILQRSGAIGYNARVSVNDAIVLGDFENSNLKVGIGVHDPQHRLDVKGVINMRAALNSPSLKINGKDFLGIDEGGEFVVSNFKMRYNHKDQWADKVFEKGYQLMPLNELETFLAKNKHLPSLPSAEEVVEKGISNQEIMAKLLEKIEELTLYQIEQDKKIQQQTKEMEALKSEMDKLKSKR